MSTENEFYKTHRGGTGAVVVVTAIDIWGNERQGIFGSMEKAQEWRAGLGTKYSCIFAPYIVDSPEWGNEATQQ